MESFQTRLQHNFFLLLLIGGGIIMFFILRPFLSALVIAFCLAVAFRPLYHKLMLVFTNKSIAAFMTVVVAIIIVLIPIYFLTTALIREGQNAYTTLTTVPGQGISTNPFVVNIESYFHISDEKVTNTLSLYTSNVLQWFIDNINIFFTEFIHLFFSTIIMIMALYYFLRDGSRLKKQYLSLSPLKKSYDEEIMQRISDTIASVIWGSLIISVLQGVLAMAGTTLAGFSNPVLLGIATGFANLVPGVGTMLVIVPAIIYLLVTGSFSSALVLAIWQMCVVILVDNIITPLLYKHGGIRVHQFFILLSILGGLAFLGPIGFILGPIVLAFFFALLEIYPVLMKKEKRNIKRNISS